MASTLDLNPFWILHDKLLSTMFVPVSKNLLSFRQREDDSTDQRLAAFVKAFDGGNLEEFVSQIQPHDLALWGYPDDRGVDRNGGRTGAAEGPDQIRGLLYKMTPCRRTHKNFRILDFGNFRSWSLSLEEAHDAARKLVGQIRARGCRIITLGGGHDWAYSDFVDLSSSLTSSLGSPAASPNHKCHLINFDAHLDMRPNPEDPNRRGHSGTPFRRILEERSAISTHKFSCVGLQEICNAPSHIQWALGHRASLNFIEDLPTDLAEAWNLLVEKLEIRNSDNTTYGVSVDMDAFPQSVSPGVSAPQAFGLDPHLPLKFFKSLGNQIRHLGIYETNPRVDVDNATSRLAARFIYEYAMIDSSR